MKLFTVNLLMLIISIAAPLYAEDKFEPSSLISESCTEVKSAAPKLSPAELEKLVEHATLSLMLPPPGVSSGGGSPQYSLGQLTRNDPMGGTGWALFDPKLESAVRRCALWILAQYPALAARHLPELCEVLSSNALLVIDSKLQEELVQHLFDIARKVPKGAVKELVLGMLPRFGTENTFFARGTLITVGSPTIPYLLDALAKADDNVSGDILSIIEAIDPNGNLSAQELIELTSKASLSKRKLILEHLSHVPSSFSKVLPNVLAKLKDETSWRFLEQISRAIPNQNPPMIALSLSEIQTIKGIFGSHSEKDLNRLSDFLLRYGQNSQRLEHALVEIIISAKSPEVKIIAVKLLGALFSEDTHAFGALLNLLSDENHSVRITAIRALANAKVRKNEVRTQLLKLLKRSASITDKNQRLETYAASGEVFAAISTESDALPALPYFIDGLTELAGTNSQDLKAIKGAISKIGPGAVPALLKLLEHSSPEIRIEALSLLNNLHQLDETTVEAVAFTFNDVDERIRTAATALVFKLLSAHDPSLTNVIAARSRKALANGKTPQGRAKAHLILLAADPSSKELIGLERWKEHFPLLTLEDKGFVFSHWQALKFPKEEVLKTVPGLLATKESEIMQMLLDLIAKMNDADFAPALRQALTSSRTTDAQRVQLMSVLEKLEPKTFSLEDTLAEELFLLSPKDVNNLLRTAAKDPLLKAAKRLLSEADPRRRERGLQITAYYGTSAQALVHQVEQLQNSEDREVRIAADQTLSMITPNDAELRSRIERKIYNGELELISAEIVPILTPAIEQKNNLFLRSTVCLALGNRSEELPPACSEYTWWITASTKQ